jgi:hypothetical protein
MVHRRIWQCVAALTLLLIAAAGVHAQALNSPKPKDPPPEKKLKGGNSTSAPEPSQDDPKPLLYNVVYTCNRERMVVTRCPSDGDDAHCEVQYPDRPRENGSAAQPTEARGALVKQVQSCQAQQTSQPANAQANASPAGNLPANTGAANSQSSGNRAAGYVSPAQSLTFQTAKTKTGRTVILKSDGTWVYGIVSKRKSPESGEPWAPPDVDATVPAVSPSTPCSLANVLAGASKRVEELVANLQQFTAAEHLEHVEIDKGGNPGTPQRRRFDYMVMIQQLRRGMLSVEEMRDGGTALDKFPANLATTGLPALALIFHPEYIEDFDMRCEGFGAWRGQPAWQVRFAQRAGRPSRMRSYRIRGLSFPIALKGRAWIAADSFQVVRLETDLVQDIPEIPLTREHMEIEYKPVAFKKKQLQVWLPESAELYMDFRGHRYYRRHSFSDFLLFSVDVNQTIADPKQP